MSMSRSSALDNGKGSPGKNLDIEPQRPSVDVLEVHRNPVVELAHRVPATYLPQTGHPWFDRQLPLVPQLIALQFMAECRTRANETHVALQHAPELRQRVPDGLAH